jgi:propanol-preferring alcohol dehydrogenase
MENLTDAMKSDIRDDDEFLPLAAQIPIVPQVKEFQLEQVNEALISLKHAKIRAAAVLRVCE